MGAQTDKNVYTINGERHIREVRDCELFRQQKERYELRCYIREFGRKDFTYTAGDTYLVRDRRKYRLDPAALATVTGAIRRERARFAEIAAAWPCARWREYRLRLYYARREDDPQMYDALLVYRGEGELFETWEPMREHSLDDILCTLAWRFDREHTGAFSPRKDRVAEHPLYRAAAAAGDRTLTAQMEYDWGTPSEETVAYLTGLDGIRRLPRLTMAFCRNYTVLTNTIDFAMLNASGYRLLHQPYFSMPGHTHACYRLNPHDKVGVDAAPTSATPITFAEYLRLFDEGATPDGHGTGGEEQPE